MILIADSGSTKTTWCYISEGNENTFISTTGINPFFRSTDDILSELKRDLFPKINGPVKNVFFYGAGIVNDKVGKGIKNALLSLFPLAESEVKSDLLAAARATLNTRKGIACILGTGSNSCLYDGKKVAEHVPPLGFILGDEGSGAVIGKKILADFLKGLMPENVAEKFRQKFPFQYTDYLQKVYKQERPNKFLASLVPFIKENEESEYCKKLLENSFEEFLKRNVFQYSNYETLEICFVGSVAFYFQESLIKVLHKNKLKVGLILKEPIEGLIQFHQNK